jgi:FkbM family methyltransferase
MGFDITETHVRGKRIMVPANDMYIGLACRVGTEWDSYMHIILRMFYKPGTDILDIGANIGCNSLLFSDYGPVHAWEPAPDMFMLLRENTQGYRVTCHQYGLFSSEGFATLYREAPTAQGVLNYGGTSILCDWNGTDKSMTFTIPLKRLDDVYTHGTPSIIKIDVEGVDLEVLKGALGIINTYKPTLIIEYLGPVTDIIQILGGGWYCAELYERNFVFTVEPPTEPVIHLLEGGISYWASSSSSGTTNPSKFPSESASESPSHDVENSDSSSSSSSPSSDE